MAWGLKSMKKASLSTTILSMDFLQKEAIEGWTNRKFVDYFGLYADACFANFGDRVKHQITLNEPLKISVNGHYIGIFAPGRNEKPLIEPYLVSHHQVLAHATDVYI
ncbi:PREDICTED: beta-glucosidase 42-like [Camelina sativa]|uniref:Beta-glucosidase 42-like n=1 Tax=Camelina sativa TaxID=90675 RepID=A0ABM1QIL9_CAMSA|nr:PREDICTED: beta-glucosidase 42-like [Camelina sativa]